jgi:hypothetical protein
MIILNVITEEVDQNTWLDTCSSLLRWRGSHTLIPNAFPPHFASQPVGTSLSRLDAVARIPLEVDRVLGCSSGYASPVVGEDFGGPDCAGFICADGD